MKLVLPNKKYQKSYIELITSAKIKGDSEELGNSSLKKNESFDEMIKRLKDRRIGKNINKRDVPATVYWIIENNEVVGTMDLRHILNKDYSERLGHIAYYIKPEMRNNGYATKALKLALNKYYHKFINKVLITCYEDNIASIKVIINNNGILKDKVFDEISQKNILKYIITVRNDELIVPKTVWLTTNRTCNNKCTWCYASKCKDKLMSFNEIKSYVNELHKIGITKIILIGGEPTIHEDIIKIVKYITSKGIIVSMASNGRKFSDIKFTKKIAKAGLKNCNISIKGANEKEYIENTKSLGFNEMVQGYNNLKKTKINVSTSYVLCDNNHEHFNLFWKTFCENKLDNISFQLYKPSVEGETYSEAPTIMDIANMCEYVFDTIKESGIKFSFEMSIPLCILKENLLEEMINKDCITTCCHISKGSGMILDSNFDILPCNHFVNHSLNKTKLKPNEIIDFWNSSEPKEFRKIINTYPHMYCKNCELWTKCGGGCFLRWLSADPSSYINEKYRKEV